MYGPYLTAAEIKAKYPNALVLLAHPKTDRLHHVLGGHVVLHAPTREEFNRLFEAWDDPAVNHLANFYTGEITGEEVLPPDPPAASGAA